MGASLVLQTPDTTKVLLTKDTVRFTDNNHHKFCDDIYWFDKDIYETDLMLQTKKYCLLPPSLHSAPIPASPMKTVYYGENQWQVISIDILTILKTIPFCTNKRFLS